MTETSCPNNNIVVLERKYFQSLLGALSGSGYDLLGPSVRDNAVVYDKIQTANDLPVGWVDANEAGRYRLEKGKRKTLFGYSLSSSTWKTFLHPPVATLYEATRDGRGFKVVHPKPDQVPRALIGVRSCELAALAIHDKILAQGPYVDSGYQGRRQNLFIVAVNCTEPGGTCFCSSMKTGPKALSGFDLALTEIATSKHHYFLVEPGSEGGRKIIEALPVRQPESSEIVAAEKQLNHATANMGRSLKIDNVAESLLARFDDSHWEAIADRCLNCGNCTMVCPTCFCTNIDDITDLSGQHASRQRRWDSCFTVDYSYIHGGSIRKSAASRYRQWLMHKLAYWPDQFGMLGCVGCGRCITWCPVGIDITEEARQLTESAK